ncbi:MAG TPA: acetyltransferase [Isosphaeraceae bacterium]|jgi:hypothetical protein|nr:acetyltransferase [Isosphaeraceae bacterium]
MARDIRPLELEDVPEVSRFLVNAFAAPADAAFAAPEVLRWKYLEPRDDRNVPRSLVARANGEIVGHGGMTHGWFHVAAEPDRRISTFHGIDWVALPEHRSTGAFLLLHGHAYSQTHYALNYSEAARRVIEGIGYKLVATVPVFRRILRPGYHLRSSGHALSQRIRAARDLARVAYYRPHPLTRAIELRPVTAFGSEIVPVLEGCAMNVIFTSRHPEWLNHALRYPRSRLSGYLVYHENRLRGFGLLNVVAEPELRKGKIVECFLDEPDPALWHAVIMALTEELRVQQADVVEILGSTPWIREGLSASGFYEAHHANFMLHDRKKLLPTNVPFHLTSFEADYAYS